jgi:hypothetical protein
LNDNVDINKAWVNIRENINISAKERKGYELKQHNPYCYKNIHSYWKKGSRLNCSGCRIKTKFLEII